MKCKLKIIQADNGFIYVEQLEKFDDKVVVCQGAEKAINNEELKKHLGYLIDNIFDSTCQGTIELDINIKEEN